MTDNSEDRLSRSVGLAMLLDVYGAMLSEEQRTALELWCSEDLSLAEIADICGITRAGVRCRLLAAEKILNELESKLGFAKKTDELRDALEVIASTLHETQAESLRRIIQEL
ncbi:MAG: DNA-binding protein [Clostridiales bacterium]|nr:DNA-binding protein [Clostridiales bacterium]